MKTLIAIVLLGFAVFGSAAMIVHSLPPAHPVATAPPVEERATYDQAAQVEAIRRAMLFTRNESFGVIICNARCQRTNIPGLLPPLWTAGVLLHDGKSRATAATMLLGGLAPYGFGVTARFERSPNPAGAIN